MTEFSNRVLTVVRRIPIGKVATYGDVAEAAGRPDVPCHRVIAAAGKLGGYGGNLELKRGLLRAEGLVVGVSSIRNFSAHRARLSGRAEATRKARGRLTKHKARKLR